jgi:hypothetical protein
MGNLNFLPPERIEVRGIHPHPFDRLMTGLSFLQQGGKAGILLLIRRHFSYLLARSEKWEYNNIKA